MRNRTVAKRGAAGPPRGGAEGDNDPRAHGLQGGPSWGRGLQGGHRNDTEKSVCERSKILFFLLEITSKSGENCGILR